MFGMNFSKLCRSISELAQLELERAKTLRKYMDEIEKGLTHCEELMTISARYQKRDANRKHNGMTRYVSMFDDQ